MDCVLIFIVFTSFKRLLCQDVPIDQYTFDGVYQWSLTSFLLAPEEVETSFNPSIWIFHFLIILIFLCVKGAVSRNSDKLSNYKMPVKLRQT